MCKCGLFRLVKKVIKWFDKIKVNGKFFDYRFKGKDFRLFLLYFMLMILVIECSVNVYGRGVIIFYVIVYICFCLRDCVFFFSYLDILDE